VTFSFYKIHFTYFGVLKKSLFAKVIEVLIKNIASPWNLKFFIKKLQKN
jgi:hypothetical protein